jgi:hypothetical protein
MIFLLVPETKQRTLEVYNQSLPLDSPSLIDVQELDYVFAVPTGRHMKYQVTTFLPYWVKRWVLFQKDAKLEPLYDFNQVSVFVYEKGDA